MIAGLSFVLATRNVTCVHYEICVYPTTDSVCSTLGSTYKMSEATTDAAQWHSWKRITTLRPLEAGSGQKGRGKGQTPSLVGAAQSAQCTQVTFLAGDKKEKPAIIFVKRLLH